MINYSPQLLNAVALAAKRLVGSNAVLQYWQGPMPATCEDQAQGVRVGSKEMPESFISEARDEIEPIMPAGADYWRLIDANGIVMMQGDGKR